MCHTHISVFARVPVLGCEIGFIYCFDTWWLHYLVFEFSYLAHCVRASHCLFLVTVFIYEYT